MNGLFARRSSRRSLPVVSILSMVVIGWWLLLGGAIVWVMPERTATAFPTPVIVAAGMTVRISQPGSPPFPIARDRAGFDALRMGAAAQDESVITRPFASFAWIDVEDGQSAYVVAVDGAAVQIEMLEGEYAGERAWLLISSLRSQR